MALQPIQSQRWIPWPETVTLTSVPAGTTLTLTNAGVYPREQRELARSNGVFLAVDVDVRVGLPDLTFTPKTRDTIAYDGNVYVILSTKKSAWLQFVAMEARCLSLTYELRDLAKLLRYTVAPGGDGLRSKTETTLADNQPCRLQPTGMTTEEERDGGYTTRERFTLFIDTAVQLFAGDAVEVSGTKYQVTGQADSSQFDTLCTIEVERIS